MSICCGEESFLILSAVCLQFINTFSTLIKLLNGPKSDFSLVQPFEIDEYIFVYSINVQYDEVELLE